MYPLVKKRPIKLFYVFSHTETFKVSTIINAFYTFIFAPLFMYFVLVYVNGYILIFLHSFIFIVRVM